MIRRALCLLVALAAPSVFAGCSGEASEEAIAPVDEATNDVVSGFKLIGSYGEGRGRYASLIFSQVTENGHRSNRYEGKQIVQCVRAPCPLVDVSGTWYATTRSLSLYPAGQPRETYDLTLTNVKLTLDNAQGTHIAELTKVQPAPDGIAQALQKHDVPKMKVEIEGAEITRQAAAAGVSVPFAGALDEALDLFLHDENGLQSTTSELSDGLAEKCGAQTDFVRCLANSPKTSIRLQKLGEETAPQGEDASHAWVFVFYVADFSDHGYYAVIDKKGVTASYVYAFN